MNMDHQSELFYLILKECIDKSITPKSVIAVKLGIGENDSAFKTLQRLKFIDIHRNATDGIELLPQGFSTYLAIHSQKQSTEQFKKSMKYATIALVISIITFIATIVSNFLFCTN